MNTLIILSFIIVGLFVIAMQWQAINYRRGFNRGLFHFYGLSEHNHICPKDTFVLVKTIHNEIFIAECRKQGDAWYCNRGIPLSDTIKQWRPLYCAVNSEQ